MSFEGGATAAAATPTSIINGGKSPANDNNNTGTITPASTMNTGNGTSAFGTTKRSSMNFNNTGKRIEIDGMMIEFQKKLGPKWDRYRDVVTGFLTGKLTRTELQKELDQTLDKNLIHMHNQFLLANLANALRDAPQNENGVLTGWSRKSNDTSRNVKGDGQLAKIKEDIMELTVRERKRIKAIAKEPANKRPHQQSSILQTRQAMLPKIPFISEKDKQQQQHQQQQHQHQQNQQQKTSAQSSPQLEQSPSQGAQAQPPQDKVAGSPSSSSPAGQSTQNNPVAWTQDIIHAYEAPLATESFELPDGESLNTRMLGISLEHGLLNGVGAQAADVLVTGLEFYLKDVIQHLADRASTHKQPGKEQVLTAEDLSDVLTSTPSSFVEMSGPTYRLQDVMLVDDDQPMVDAPPLPNDDNAMTPELLNLVDDILSAN